MGNHIFVNRFCKKTKKVILTEQKNNYDNLEANYKEIIEYLIECCDINHFNYNAEVMTIDYNDYAYRPNLTYYQE